LYTIYNAILAINNYPFAETLNFSQIPHFEILFIIKNH